MRIVVDLELSPIQKKVVRSAVVVGALVGALGIGVAVAKPTDTSWITSGGTVGAANLKKNLDDLQAQASKPVIERDGGSYSLGATYCATATATMTGYAAAKASCQAACSNSASAHMCDAMEVQRSAALGITMPRGWYATMTVAHQTSAATDSARDCVGWSNKTSAKYGSLWAPAPNGPSPDYDTCDKSVSEPVPYLCCD